MPLTRSMLTAETRVPHTNQVLPTHFYLNRPLKKGKSSQRQAIASSTISSLDPSRGRCTDTTNLSEVSSKAVSTLNWNVESQTLVGLLGKKWFSFSRSTPGKIVNCCCFAPPVYFQWHCIRMGYMSLIFSSTLMSIFSKLTTPSTLCTLEYIDL